MKPLTTAQFDKLYWFRVGLGAAGGGLAQLIFGADGLDGLLIGVIGYLGSWYVGKFWYKSADRQTAGKIYSTGLGAYFVVFLFTWVLLFTLASS